MPLPRYPALAMLAVAAFAATPAQARRRHGGGGGNGDDAPPWLNDAVIYILIGFAALVVIVYLWGVLWRRLTRRSAADMARARSLRRQQARSRRVADRGPRSDRRS